MTTPFAPQHSFAKTHIHKESARSVSDDILIYIHYNWKCNRMQLLSMVKIITLDHVSCWWTLRRNRSTHTHDANASDVFCYLAHTHTAHSKTDSKSSSQKYCWGTVNRFAWMKVPEIYCYSHRWTTTAEQLKQIYQAAAAERTYFTNFVRYKSNDLCTNRCVWCMLLYWAADSQARRCSNLQSR